MTQLVKKVSRRVTLFLDHRMAARARDQFTVTLTPEKTITFRPLRSHKVLEVPLEAVLLMAYKNEELEQRRAQRRSNEF